MMTADNTLIFINGYQLDNYERFRIDIDSSKQHPEGFISIKDEGSQMAAFVVEDIDFKDNIFKLHIKIEPKFYHYFEKYYEDVEEE